MQTDTKKRLYRRWKVLRAVRPAYLLVAFVISLGLAVYGLRQNNLQMAELRQAVYAADKENGDVEGALRALRTYVHSHMNTDLSSGANSVYPPLQLKYTYERLVAAEQARIKSENENIYTAAQAHCERLYPESYSGGPRVPCIREYVTSRGVEAKQIPDSLYKFDFMSPVWSPDLAGWSVLAAFVFGLMLVVRIMVPRILRALRVL